VKKPPPIQRDEPPVGSIISADMYWSGEGPYAVVCIRTPNGWHHSMRTWKQPLAWQVLCHYLRSGAETMRVTSMRSQTWSTRMRRIPKRDLEQELREAAGR
jgi:hypothetical protein